MSIKNNIIPVFIYAINYRFSLLLPKLLKGMQKDTYKAKQ